MAIRQATKRGLKIKIVEENGPARYLEVKFQNMNKTINTPNYIVQTKSGSFNGMTKYNLKNVELPIASLNFPDMYAIKGTLEALKKHITDGNNEMSFKKYFNMQDKVMMLSPFPYSENKERITGLNDHEYLQMSDPRAKVHVKEQFKIVEHMQPELVIPPCEQVTQTSGKKKRKRATKAALKNFQSLDKILKEQENSQTSILIPAFLGNEDDCLDYHELKQLRTALQNEDEHQYQGFIIYGTDLLSCPAKQQEIKDLFEEFPKEKLRVLHGTGSPIEVLNGVLGGVDLFEGDYPLELASKGIALQMKDFQLQKTSKHKNTILELSKLLDTKQLKTLDMSKKENQHSKDPILKKCQCYTCRKYNKAYLYHLIDVNEMNANILIGIHNMWVYDRFFIQLRSSIQHIEDYVEQFIGINCEDKV